MSLKIFFSFTGLSLANMLCEKQRDRWVQKTILKLTRSILPQFLEVQPLGWLGYVSFLFSMKYFGCKSENIYDRLLRTWFHSKILPQLSDPPGRSDMYSQIIIYRRIKQCFQKHQITINLYPSRPSPLHKNWEFN